jgi:putative membrane protein
MTAFQPGFVDGPKSSDPRPETPPTETLRTETTERPLNPGFIETTSTPPEPVPAVIHLPSTSPGAGALGWIGAGLGILVLGGSVLALIGFVLDQMARSPVLGWVSLAIVATGLLAVLWGVTREIRSYRRLTRVDRLRATLRSPALPIETARKECTAWLETIANKLPDPDSVRLAMNGCTTTDEIRAMLAHRAIEPLREQATAIGTRAASQGAALVAIIPSPALDGLAAGVRSLKLIRDVATLYGLRPGVSVTLGLVRRATVTAASVYGVNEIAGAAAAHFLADAPVLRSIASAAPGAGITARRIYLLARTVAETCSPL